MNSLGGSLMRPRSWERMKIKNRSSNPARDSSHHNHIWLLQTLAGVWLEGYWYRRGRTERHYSCLLNYLLPAAQHFALLVRDRDILRTNKLSSHDETQIWGGMVYSSPPAQTWSFKTRGMSLSLQVFNISFCFRIWTTTILNRQRWRCKNIFTYDACPLPIRAQC